MPKQMIDGLEWIEPDITINKVELTVSEALTLRMALLTFQGSLCDGLSDEKTKGMYEIHIARLIELMSMNSEYEYEPEEM